MSHLHAIPEPDYDSIVTEDDKPVDNMYCERQHRLLPDCLGASWQVPGGKGRPYYTATDVGVFYSPTEPPLVPDVFVSLDVLPPSDFTKKRNRSYFIWVFKKPPDLVVEVVSNKEGGELDTKLADYARLAIQYYVVWDPCRYLGKKTLHCFALKKGKYIHCDPWFPLMDLGVTIWKGEYEKMSGAWLRWCDRQGAVLPTGVERAETAEHHAASAEMKAKTQKQKAKSEKQRAESEKQRAESEKQRAESEKQRADAAEERAKKLTDKMRSLGIDPDQA